MARRRRTLAVDERRLSPRPPASLHQASQQHQQAPFDDHDFIPLPIQTFLWRQTSPFVRPYLGKARDLAQIEQRDACKLFERIIITNNIWGQSPSLTDAIASIDRWRLIKVSFPFVLQCTAALLNNKLIKDHNFNRLGGNEAKMMYTLQWILMNASEECADSENEAKTNATNVALSAATAASLLKPCSAFAAGQPTSSGSNTQVSSHQQAFVSQGSTSSGTSTHQQRQQSSPRHDPQQPAGASTRGGSTSSCAAQSIIIPAASVAASAMAAVASPTAGFISSLQMQTTLPCSSSSVSPIGSSTPTKPLTPTQQPPSSANNYLLPLSSIQMFVYYFAPIMDGLKHSDFLSSNQRLEIGAALWEPLFDHQLPNVQCLATPLKPNSNCSRRNFDQANQSSFSFFSSHDESMKKTQAETNLANKSSAPEHRRKSSTVQTEQGHLGDVFLGNVGNHSTPSRDECSVQLKHSTKFAAQQATQDNSTPTSDQQINDENGATYLDVAALRCLFISDWQESGVHWALTYLSKRMLEFRYQYNCSQSRLHRKSRSLENVNAIIKSNVSSTFIKRLKSQQVAHLRRAADRYVEKSSSAGVKFLKVEDIEITDSGNDTPVDGDKSSKSPVRRLSFSSGMQTLANQIRKKSKYSKKSLDGGTRESCTGDSNEGSQMSVQHQTSSIDSKHPYSQNKIRRSSSADDLSSGQLINLAMINKDALQAHTIRTKDKNVAESTPVITVTPQANSFNQIHYKNIEDGCDRPKLMFDDEKEQSHLLSSANNTESPHQTIPHLAEAGLSDSLRNLERLSRSQSVPKDLHYSIFETRKDRADGSEYAGAAHYLDDHGRIDPIVVLKILHAVSQRNSTCSQRVCDKILSLVSQLINLGILKEDFNYERNLSSERNLAELLPTARQYEFPLLVGSTHVLTMDSDHQLNNTKQANHLSSLIRASIVHKVLIDIILRLYLHHGCPNSCGLESTVENFQAGQLKSSTSAVRSSSTGGSFKTCRLILRDTLDHLCNYNRNYFINYVENVLKERPLQQVVDMLHGLLGFCSKDYINSLAQSTKNLNQPVAHTQGLSTSGVNINSLQQSRNNPCGSLSSTHSDISNIETNYRANSKLATRSQTNTCHTNRCPEGVESLIVSRTFKQLVTRMSSLSKELKSQENTSLYCDIRRLINFVRDVYNGVFRGIVLSALIDCAKMQNQHQRAVYDDISAMRKLGDLTSAPSDDEIGACVREHSHIKRTKNLSETSDLTDNDNSSRLQNESAMSCSSNNAPQNPSIKQHDVNVLQHRTSFESGWSFNPSQAKTNSKQIGSTQTVQQQDAQSTQSSGLLSLSKAKKKLEQVFGSKSRPSTCDEAHKISSAMPGELEQASQIQVSDDISSRRASLVAYHNIGSFNENEQSKLFNCFPGTKSQTGIKFNDLQRIQLNQKVHDIVRDGMLNFTFLMESCSPGDFLDPALLAALLDLKSPVAIRAAIYMECANFVHRCNRGQWPSWMRMNISVHRGSNAGIVHQGGSKFRKSSSIQRGARNNTLMYRSAGKAFYCWAEAIGARLEELIQVEKETMKDNPILEDHEIDASQTSNHFNTTSNLINDSELDLFQPSIDGNSSPFILKMAACQLLFEVTTFLRETYRYLPPTITRHQASSSKLGEKMTSIYDVSRAVTANRRWSMALSSLGFGQLPATLSAISTSNASTTGGTGHLRNPVTSTIPEVPERRISFVLHETKDENVQGESNSLENQAQPDTSSSQSATSPIAPSVNTAEQQSDAMKKMTAGRNLSQSSASSAVVVAAATCLLRSSGVIDSQSHRRKSIKLKKPSQDREQRDRKTKFAQDLDEELENSSISDTGMRRTDSLHSRRRVSGISEKSDTSDRAVSNAQHITQDGQATCEVSGDESAGNGSCEEGFAQETSERYEDESKIMSNMPWFKAISLVNASIDCHCNHFPACTANCFKLHQELCRKMIVCVQSVYQEVDSEQNRVSSIFESRLSNLMNLGEEQRSLQNNGRAANSLVNRTGSDCSSSIINQNDNLMRKEKKSKKNHQFDPSAQEEDTFSKIRKSHKFEDNRISSIKSLHPESISSSNEISPLMADAIKALTAVKAKKRATAQRIQEESQIIKYIRSNVKSLLHCPMSAFLKGAVILPRDSFMEMIKFSWNLLLEDDQQLSRTAAVGFIISAIKCPAEASKLLLEELESTDACKKIAAINKFYVIWDARYQCWPRLEDGAFVHFKMAPPSIEFTLPSPKIAQESKPVVDPPWMPRKTSNVEEVTIGQDQTVQKSFVTATKTRRKQQIEIVTKALREKYDKLREDRENYNITSVPITLYAAYEPTLSNQTGSDELDGGGDEDTQQENRALLQMKSAQALFPTCLCQAAIVMINLLDDSRVTYEGSAVYEIAGKVIWSCLVEDPALFLRYFFERLTRQNQSTIFQVLRRLIRFMPRLPPQAAYTLYNYLIGFIIYYIRCPVESSQKLIADTLSVLCLVVPSVYGLFLKDLKQILRKEQCDHNLLITANVPSAKKIIVHGSDSSGIPSQFPIDESTQFYHILVDSLEFFGIEKPKQNEYFLIDVRTNQMHNIHSYVRDYYSFKRSQHPQLQLINMDSNKAFDILQKQELISQFMEFGKVSMSLAIVKSSHMAVQRVLFLHEELMKLPTFPRKALETNFSLFRGSLGHQVFSMDRIHKICWARVIARMFELTSGFFLQLGDIHLFLNAISGIFVLHCEEASVSRLCLATFINASYQFKNIFASDGFMPVMSTIIQVYSNHQNNQLLCRSIEFVCKQFYIMHRKPFLLQLFGSVAARLNTSEISRSNQANYPLSSNQLSAYSSPDNFVVNDPSRISPTAFFRLLQSLEKAFKDPLDILELVDAEKPLRAVDFCYQQDKEAIEILDIISLCVTVTAYASDSPRSTQMLIILETVVPLYMKHLQACTSKKAGQSMGKQAHKDELQKIQSISICIRTLIVNCEGLTRNFNGPLPSIDFRSSSIRRTNLSRQKNLASSHKNQSNSAGSPVDIYNDEPSYSGVEKGKREPSTSNATGKQATIASGPHKSKTISNEESEVTRGEFIVPRDTLLNLVAEFLSISTGRLVESAKKYVELHQKHASYELLDVKSHLRLAEVANSLLKFASTDPSVMACRGLTRYINEILPNTEWRQEAIRPALIMILKRLDKTFNRIAKKSWVKRSTDWEGAKQLLKGAYLTFIKHPYIVHLPHLKSLISCCQNIILSDGTHNFSVVSTSNLFHSIATQASQSTSSHSATNIQRQSSNERLTGNNPLTTGSAHITPGTLTPSASGGGASTVPGSMMHTNPTLAQVSAAATLADRLVAQSSSSTASQGFNSVTIRLIAMQLLQTGESQTLESFIGTSMNTPEKLESCMLNLIYPMCIRVCSGAREAPKLRVCDIMYILNIVLNMLAPQSASSKSCSSTANSPKTATDTSQFILSKITTTIGSTQTGATALGIVGSSSHSTNTMHQHAQHQEGLKIGFLGLKILCVCFEQQLASEWIRISRVIRDLALQNGQPNGPLWDFLDFVATYRFPVFILLLPTIKCHLAKKVTEELSGEHAAHHIRCQRLINAKISGAAPTVCRSKSFLFVSLTAELRMLKEQLIAKRRMLLEGERNTAPQAGGQTQTIHAGQTLSSAHGGQTTDGQGTAYHRLSAAIASFANQSVQGRSISGSAGVHLGTSAALKGTCFAAQLATSTPIGPQLSESDGNSVKITHRIEPSQSSIRLSTAKSREEARKVMNTILRRTSYPHNQVSTLIEQPASSSGDRKNSQSPSPSSSIRQQVTSEEDPSSSTQIIMDPAMLMAAFPPPRKTNIEGSGILKQLIQTIDGQNLRLQKQTGYQTTVLTNESGDNKPLGEQSNIDNTEQKVQKSISQSFSSSTGHLHR